MVDVNGVSQIFVGALAKFGVILLYGVFLGLPIIIGGVILTIAMLYKHKVIIYEPGGKIRETKAYITKAGQMTLRKPKYKVDSFSLEKCSINEKGKYVFHLWKENSNSYRQIKPLHLDEKGKYLIHVAEEKGIEFLLEEWKRKQTSVWTLEGFEKYKDMAMLFFIIFFNIISMAMLAQNSGLGS